MCATPMAFIEDLAPQKIRAKITKQVIFCGTGFYKRREKNCQEEKKKRRRGRENKRKSHREQIKAIF